MNSPYVTFEVYIENQQFLTEMKNLPAVSKIYKEDIDLFLGLNIKEKTLKDLKKEFKQNAKEHNRKGWAMSPLECWSFQKTIAKKEKRESYKQTKANFEKLLRSEFKNFTPLTRFISNFVLLTGLDVFLLIKDIFQTFVSRREFEKEAESKALDILQSCLKEAQSFFNKGSEFSTVNLFCQESKRRRSFAINVTYDFLQLIRNDYLSEFSKKISYTSIETFYFDVSAHLPAKNDLEFYLEGFKFIIPKVRMLFFKSWRSNADLELGVLASSYYCYYESKKLRAGYFGSLCSSPQSSCLFLQSLYENILIDQLGILKYQIREKPGDFIGLHEYQEDNFLRREKCSSMEGLVNGFLRPLVKEQQKELQNTLKK